MSVHICLGKIIIQHSFWMENCVSVSPVCLLAWGLIECFFDEVVTQAWVETLNRGGNSGPRWTPTSQRRCFVQFVH